MFSNIFLIVAPHFYRYSPPLYFGMVLGWFGNGLGIVLGSLGNRFGIVFGSVLGSSWDRLGTPPLTPIGRCRGLYIGVRGFPTRGYFIPGRDGGQGPGG